MEKDNEKIIDEILESYANEQEKIEVDKLSEDELLKKVDEILGEKLNENLNNQQTEKDEEVIEENVEEIAKNFVDDLFKNVEDTNPKEENELENLQSKIEQEEFEKEVEEFVNKDVNLDALTPEEDAQLDKELENLQSKIEQEEFDKVVNNILNEEVDLEALTAEEDAKLEQELNKLEAELREDNETVIAEAETNAQTPNTSFVQDEAPLPDQENVVVTPPKKNEKLVIAVTDINGLVANEEIELQNLYPNQEKQDTTKEKTKEDKTTTKTEDKNDNTKQEVKEAPKPLSELDKSLNDVSRSSGLNLKAYFVEDNKKEIEQLKKNGNLKSFEFNGDLKSFYTEAYRYVLESNMIARQIDPDNKSLPDIAKLTEKFEVFMKNVGQELKDRNHIEEYVPFGGLTAHEIRQIQKDVLMNRPQTKEEALQKNASKLGGKNYEEKMENAYQLAHNTIEANFGKDYKVGLDPKMDEKKLANAVDAIKGAILIDENQKLWETYKPKFTAPDFKKPIWRHLITNTFKLISKGISIALDCAIKFPLTNAFRGVMYVFEKPGSAIMRNNKIQKLEEALMAKGFKRAQIREKIRENNSKTLDVEKDSKNIDKQFEKNLKTINAYKESKEKEKNKTVEKTTGKEMSVQQEQKELNPNKQSIIVEEAAPQLYEGETAPEIKDKTIVKTQDLKI